MLPYILMIAIPAMLLFVEKYRTSGSLRGALSVETPSTNRALVVFFAIFLALLCLRDIYVGCDLINYRRVYFMASGMTTKEYNQLLLEEIPRKLEVWGATISNQIVDEQVSDTMIMHTDGFEPLFKLLNNVLAKCSVSFRIFLIVCAFISVFPIGFFYVKESRLPLLTISLFVAVAPFSFFFSNLRQAIAIGFIIPLYYYARDKKTLKFFALVMIAIGFHYSAIVSLLLYPLFCVKITRRRMLILFPLICVVFIWKREILEFCLSIAGYYGDKYGRLVDSGSYGMLILYAIFLVYSFVIPEEGKMTQEDFGLRNILILIVCIQIFVPVHTLFMRIGYYYHVFIPVIIPRLIKSAHPRVKNLSILSVYVMVVFFLCYFIYSGYTDADILKVFPYFTMECLER